MFKRLLLFLMLSLSAVAFPIDGFIATPAGGITGSITFSLKQNAQALGTLCPSNGDLIASSTKATAILTNGNFASHPDIVPSDCLSPAQPYVVVVRDATNKVLMQDSWWVSYSARTYPANGNKRVHLTGMFLQGTATQFTAYTLGNGGYRTKTITAGTVNPGGTVTSVITWPKAFADTNYGVGCSVNGTPSRKLFIDSIGTQTVTSVVVVVSSQFGISTHPIITCHAWEN